MNKTYVINGVKPLSLSQKDEFKIAKKGEVYSPSKLTFEITGGSSSMPRGAWWGPYRPYREGYPDYLTEEYFSLMKQSNLNFICAIANNIGSHEQATIEALDKAYAFDIGCFVNDYSFRNQKANEIIENVPKYIDHPACLGIHVYDEPYPDDLPKLRDMEEVFWSNFGDRKYLYFNLFPTYGKFGDDDVRLKNYEQYLEDCCKQLKLKMLSYDYYAFKKSEYEWGRIKMFYDNLSLSRKVSKKNNIPFWTFVQAGDAFYFDRKNDGSILFPTREMFIWNVNVNLCYGTKAMQYYTFIQPTCPSSLNDMNCRTLGMIGADGKKNVWFDYVKEANSVIESIEHYLMNSENLGVMISGKVTKTLITGDEVLSSFNELSSVSGGEAVVGCCSYNGKTLLYVVNNDYQMNQRIDLSFNDVYAFEVIINNEAKSYIGKNVALSINAGEGVLIRLL